MESSPKIAVVGFSVRAATQCATRQGFEVIAVDMCSDRDLVSECKDHYQLNAPDWPAALHARYPNVPILLAGGMENRPQLVEECQARGLVSGADAIPLRAMRSLENWAVWALASELGWPVTLRTQSEIQRADEVYPGFEWLVKPIVGSGGNAITEWTKKERQAPASFYPTATSYIQQRLKGEPIGVTFLSSPFGSIVVGATASWQPESSFEGGPKYAYRGSYGPIDLSSDQLLKLRNFANLVGAQTELLGLWQADFLRSGDKLTLLEINPRWSASMDILDVSLLIPMVQHHYLCICSLLNNERFLEIASTYLERSASPNNVLLGKLIVYAPKPFVVAPNQSDKWWSQRWSGPSSLAAKGHLYADIPNPSTSISVGEPVLTVMATERTLGALMAELQRGKMEVLDEL